MLVAAVADMFVHSIQLSRRMRVWHSMEENIVKIFPYQFNETIQIGNKDSSGKFRCAVYKYAEFDFATITIWFNEKNAPNIDSIVFFSSVESSFKI